MIMIMTKNQMKTEQKKQKKIEVIIGMHIQYAIDHVFKANPVRSLQSAKEKGNVLISGESDK